MSLHINTPIYQCKRCSAYFIAFEDRLPCPNCGEPEDSEGENYNFIEQLARSLAINKQEQGSFMPSAWFSGCDMDRVQALFFRLFDEREKTEPSELLIRLENNNNNQLSYEERHTVDTLKKVTIKYQEMFPKHTSKLKSFLSNLKNHFKQS